MKTDKSWNLKEVLYEFQPKTVYGWNS